MRTHPKDVVSEYIEAWNTGDLDAFARLLAPDYVNHTPGTPDLPTGPEGVAAIAGYLRTAFPDYTLHVEDIRASGDEVIVRSRLTGTHDGEFAGHAPTGRRIDVDQLQIERVRDGRIVEHWRVTDELEIMRQLGLVES